LGNAVVTKKQRSILSKYINTVIACLVVIFSTSAQDKSKTESKSGTWEQERKYLKYERTEDYDGPDYWGSSDPSDIKENRYIQPGTVNRRMYGGKGRGGGTVRYQPQQIQRQRQKHYRGFNRGGGNGTLKYDPKVKRPDPVKPPKTAPRRKVNMSSPDINTPSTSQGFWKVLFIVILIALAMTIVYLIIRNKQPADTKVIVDVENDWNPEVITKTELDLKLEAAMAREDYRECVRIYFTFILKELIHKGWIHWKKEKTNHHYVMEMGRRDGAFNFMECVRIYDLVWYGEYQIDREIFEILQPTLLNYYKSLDPVNE